MVTNRPYFLWDYDLTEKDVRRLLKNGNETTRLWLTTRILEGARFDDVWKYLKIKELVEVFHRLKLREPVGRAWQRALKVWGYIK